MRRFLATLMLATGFLCASCSASPDAASPDLQPEIPSASPEPTPAPSPSPPFAVGRRQLTIPAPDGGWIGGVLYQPEELSNAPLVICAHGLGASYRSMEPWAEALCCEGLAAFCFDFRGTGSTISSGDATEMSPLTEAEDIAVLLEAAADWAGVDADRIVLLGESQGGFAAAVAAGRDPKRVAGLMLLYPAFVIPDDVRARFPDLADIPEMSADYLWVTVGSRYATDMHGYDAYSEIAAFTDPVLIIHGSDDDLVPLSYSEQAVRVYPDARLEIIRGAGHGFGPADAQTALELMMDFLQQIGILPAH